MEQPLRRDEVRAVIEGRGQARRVPMSYYLWLHPSQFAQHEPEVAALKASCDDIQFVELGFPDLFQAPADDPSYRWMNIDEPAFEPSAGLDDRASLQDWSQFEAVLADFPKPTYPALVRPDSKPPDGRYRVANWWYGLYERHWSLRGMSNALMDYYTNPREVHRLYQALTDFYIGAIERAARELKADAIMTSDDIGTQTGPFFSPQIFREFLKPYYRQMIQRAHELGMHLWLHSCGNIEPFLEDFIEIGLDVIHPIQKYAMDERQIGHRYGQRICIWGGFDVQRTLPLGSEQDVRREVRFMMDTYHRKSGRFMITAGNGISPETPLANLHALFEETVRYGAQVSLER